MHLTMQAVADVANVRRPVVSVWRDRFKDSATPFPASIDDASLLFDAGEVGLWLQETGLGNNPDAHLETALHSALFTEAKGDPQTLSTLLLLGELSGNPTEDLDLHQASQIIESLNLEDVLPLRSVPAALMNKPACRTADALIEAAYSGSRALTHLFNSAQKETSSGEIFTEAASQFLGCLFAKVHSSQRGVLVPLDLGGLLVNVALAGHLDESEALTLRPLQSPNLPTLPEGNSSLEPIAWRLLAAKGAQFEQPSPPTFRQITYLSSWADAPNPSDFFTYLEELVQELSGPDVLFVIGPAEYMIDEGAALNRRSFLTPSVSYTERLRYSAELPRGLSRYQPRRRLALWAFGFPEGQWTVTASHAAMPTTTATASLMASDISAALTGHFHTHAFYRSAIRASHQFLRSDRLSLPPDPGQAKDGGERLARIWELGGDFAQGLNLIADTENVSSVLFSVASKTLAYDLPGSRIPKEIIGSPTAGTAAVVGKPELEGNASIGSRAVDRLVLEETTPSAQPTLPGDVIYISQHPPTALVDHNGGSFVQTPARIFRCKKGDPGKAHLHPEVVAADIKSSKNTPRKDWQLRTIQGGAASALDAIVTDLNKELSDLHRKLSDLSEMKTEVIHGIADGTLRQNERVNAHGA